MDVEPSNALYDLPAAEHPTYWVRLWVQPSVYYSDDGTPYAWSADSFRVTGAIDVHEVFAWARAQNGWAEVFVEVPALNPTSAVVIAGFNAARSDGRPPAEYISDPKRAVELAALLRSVYGEPQTDNSESTRTLTATRVSDAE